MTPRDSERSESDVEPDPHVASSRADDDFDAEESGAEARGRHRRPD